MSKSDTNSEDDAEQYSSELSDDENHHRPYQISSPHHDKATLESNFKNVTPLNPSIDAVGKIDDWRSSYSVGENWNCRSVLNDKTQTRLKINLSKVKKVKIKKPCIGISRRKKDLSSLYDTNPLKKRSKYVLSNATKKRSTSENRQETTNYVQCPTVNGTNGENASTVEPINIEVPKPSSISSAFSWNNDSQNVGSSISGDEGTNVGEYAQYLELKPSIKFRCYRCGINDFSTMALLQEHIAACNGKIRNDSVTQSSPVRTMKPLNSTVTASPNLRITRKVFLCSSCGTYYQNYNLYIHMRDKHNKQICLFCRNIFSRSEQLWHHLVTVHKLNSTKYSDVSQIRIAFKSSFYITCCSCNSIFSDDEPFDSHVCENLSHAYSVDGTFHSDCRTSVIPRNETSKIASETCKQRPESVSSFDEYDGESNFEVENDFMSRDSTLELIGVPENHTISLLPNGIWDMFNPEFPLEKDNVTILNSSSPIGTIPSGFTDISNGETQPIDDKNDMKELSPIFDLAEEPVQKTELVDTEKKLDVIESAVDDSDEPPGANKPDNFADNFVDTKGDDDNEESSISEVENITNQAPALVTDFEPTTTLNPIEQKEMQSADIKPNIAEADHIETVPPPLTMALMLDEMVESLSTQSLLRECVRTSCLTCLYCNNATVIAVNGHQLAAHLINEHRFMPTKHDEDCQQVIKKLEAGMNDLKDVYMNATFSSHKEISFDGTFACLQCSFSTQLFKDLCHHKRRTHHKVIFLCIMCKCNFQFYSQLLCHLCPGSYSSETLHSLTYHCCFCDVNLIPSAFRLMVHLRKMHQACDICLSRHADQSELYTHMIKQHKINHLCFKCNLAWRSRDDINKHLFWKHGTESVLCKRCLQKKWPHAYHFCIPASTYSCDECNRTFTKAVALTVHRRVHNGEFPFVCDLCEQRCISKKLLALHREDEHHIMREPRPDTEKNGEVVNENGDKDSNEIQSNKTSGDNEAEKERRKKRRKKMKNGNEKPLLDELPPLNLSSESEDESGDDENVPVKTKALLIGQPSAEDEPASEKRADFSSEPVVDQLREIDDENAPREVVALAETSKDDVIDEKSDEVVKDALVDSNLIEKILNCLIVEHSYCIPDSIFRSEVTNHSAVSESSDNANKQHSPKPCSKRDKSCCKSITPRKRKRVPKRESSSSDSSTDSDSSSSTCGSNCSCNKSASNSSSSSSSESTTPEKRAVTKKKGRAPGKEQSTAADEASARELSLLSVPESELDTDIATSDEDFYEQHPFVVPQPPPTVETIPDPTAAPALPYENKITIHANSLLSPSRVERKTKKRKKKAKVTINLGSMQRGSAAAKGPFGQRVNASQHLPVNQPKASSTYTSYPTGTAAATLAYQASSAATFANCMNTVTSTPSPALSSIKANDSGRPPKRKRVKNRFYGYSSSDETSGNESLKTTIHLIKKRPSQKKAPKSQPRLPFVGIRAKKPLTLMSRKHFPPNSSVLSNASPPPDLYHFSSPTPNDAYRQRNFVKPVVPESSDDSDSDERRHTLVINLPQPKEKTFNHGLNYRSSLATPAYSDSGGPFSSSGWFSQRTPTHLPQLPSTTQVTTTPNKKEVYCFCRCPYDEVSEMIACDGPNCAIEWFHFECVGIMAAPKGQWFCPNCRKNPENVCRSF